MENPELKWRWPTKRLQQIFLVLLAVSLCMQICVLGLQLFNSERIRIPSSPLGITIAIVISALIWSIFTAWIISTTRKYTCLAVGTALFWWSRALKDVAGHVPVDRRFFLEVLITLLYGAVATLYGLSILRGEWNKSQRGEQAE
ncbi:MAG: hypothetical protein JXA21_04355 [Anaerolineae bacterium]|nr:hypothetical protein [Anaerolineae bacterium]